MNTRKSTAPNPSPPCSLLYFSLFSLSSLSSLCSCMTCFSASVRCGFLLSSCFLRLYLMLSCCCGCCWGSGGGGTLNLTWDGGGACGTTIGCGGGTGGACGSSSSSSISPSSRSSLGVSLEKENWSMRFFVDRVELNTVLVCLRCECSEKSMLQAFVVRNGLFFEIMRWLRKFVRTKRTKHC